MRRFNQLMEGILKVRKQFCADLQHLSVVRDPYNLRKHTGSDVERSGFANTILALC